MKRKTIELIIGVLVLGIAMWSLSSCTYRSCPTYSKITRYANHI